MKDQLVPIRSKKDFVSLIDHIDDIDFMTANHFTGKVPKVTIKLEGKPFHSSLTGSIIEGLHRYQQAVYKAYRQNKYGKDSRKKLTPEEAEQLEIKVTIKEGSTDMILSFISDLSKLTESTNMSGTDVIILISIIAGVWLIKGLAVPAIKGHYDVLKTKIKSKQKDAKTEAEQTFYTQMNSTLQTAVNGALELCKAVVQSPSQKIRIDNKEIPAAHIAQYINTLEEMPQVKENQEKQYMVEGDFKVLNLNYEGPTTMMKALHVESGKIYDNISLQNGWIAEERYKAIIEAEQREPIYFKILIYEKGAKRQCAIDINSIDVPQ